MAKSRIALIAILALLFLLGFAYFMRGAYFSAGTLKPDKTLEVTVVNFDHIEIYVFPRDYRFTIDCQETSGRRRILKPDSRIEWPTESSPQVVKPLSTVSFSVTFSAAEPSQIGCKAASVSYR
jgi:hypothetical protein